MLLRRFYHTGLAQASYMIGCQATGEALVVDPNRDIDQYIEAAAHEGLRVTAVTETHIHADYTSGARELAHHTGAQLYLSDAGPAEWQYAYASEAGTILVHDGSSFKVGNVRIDVLHMPGHTPEHIVFLVTDTRGASEPMGLLTGDFVFVGDVGRPDLLERAAGFSGTMEDAARTLFGSLQRFRNLPEYLQIWPGHGAGSACGKALGAVPQTTVGYEMRFNWALAIKDEESFVKAVLEGQPDPPFYFAQMKRINRDGPALRPTEPLCVQGVDELAGALASGMPVVDLRSSEAYAKQFIPGTLNIAAETDFVTWAGWMLPYDRPIGLIGAPEQLEQIRAELQMIGLDTIAAVWHASVFEEWQVAGKPLGQRERHSAAELRAQIEQGDSAILDVRATSEYAAGHIHGSRNIPLGQLTKNGPQANDIAKKLFVTCQSGRRSAIAASLLQGRGITTIELSDGFEGWVRAGGAVEV